MPDFARHAPDALQCYADLLKETDLPHWKLGGEGWPRFREAPVYFWSSVNAEVIAQASVSYPLQRDVFIPSLSRAFVVFQRPVLGDADPVSALYWEAGISHGQPALLMVAFHWEAGHIRLGNAAGINDPWDITHHPKPMPTPIRSSGSQWTPDQTRSWMRWILTACMFTEQRIMLPVVQPVNKHVSSRVAALGVVPTCHVIQLRRIDGRSQGAGESDVEWACRWLVRGHWRRQFYPSANRRVPIWIDAHIKGPADKPLRAPAPEVFAVTR